MKSKRNPNMASGRIYSYGETSTEARTSLWTCKSPTQTPSPMYGLIRTRYYHQKRKNKKSNYLDLRLNKFFHLIPFFFPTEGMMGREATTLAMSLTLKLSRKWRRPYSHIYGHLKTCLSVVIIHDTHL